MDVMLDLECLGKSTDAAILQIGACSFDIETGDVGKWQFLRNINLDSCLRVGLSVDDSTFRWWMDQSDEACKSLSVPAPVALGSALYDFSKEFAWSSSVRLWSHESYDEPILDTAYQKCNQKVPWHYRRTRDIRTLIDNAFGDDYEAFRKAIESIDPNTLKHNALADAVYQAHYVIVCHNVLRDKMSMKSPLDPVGLSA